MAYRSTVPHSSALFNQCLSALYFVISAIVVWHVHRLSTHISTPPPPHHTHTHTHTLRSIACGPFPMPFQAFMSYTIATACSTLKDQLDTLLPYRTVSPQRQGPPPPLPSGICPAETALGSTPPCLQPIWILPFGIRLRLGWHCWGHLSPCSNPEMAL